MTKAGAAAPGELPGELNYVIYDIILVCLGDMGKYAFHFLGVTLLWTVIIDSRPILYWIQLAFATARS